jgi:hypothetical protein
MAKPDRTNLKDRLSLSGLIHWAALDLQRHIGDAETQELIFLAASDLKSCLSFIEARLRVAEENASTKFLTLAAWRQLAALFEKNADMPGTTPAGRKENALVKFISSEMKCKRTNRRLRFYRTYFSRRSEAIGEVLGMAQDICQDIFGPLGTLNYRNIVDSAGFGPGFTFASSRPEDRHLYFKLSGHHTITDEALPYLKSFLAQYPLWKEKLLETDSTFERVRGNRVTSVPKNALTDRTIAIEPSFNVFMQKGVDSYLKSRLRHFGVKLDDQTRNHEPARRGSMEPLKAATIDISGASDCVSIELVRELVPPLWFTLLDDFRSKEFTLDKGKTWTRYEKFSSMGNAFTFPLESIIFFSLAKACTIHAGGSLDTLRVYGDDIIVDPRAYALLLETLDYAGFSANPNKSFAFGNFRETCGSDFYNGVDLRPVYVRNLPTNDQQVYNLFNRLIWNRVGFKLHKLCSFLHRAVKRPLYGPPHLPPGEKYWKWIAGKSVQFDHYFHSSPDLVQRFRRYDSDLQCFVWKIQILRFIPQKMDTSKWAEQFWYLAFLLGIQGSKVNSNSRFRRMVQYEVISYWPEPPWQPYLCD